MKHDARYNRFSKAEKWFIDKRIYIYIYLITAFLQVTGFAKFYN